MPLGSKLAMPRGVIGLHRLIIGKNVKKSSSETGERSGLVVNASDSGSRGWGFEPPLGSNRVVTLSKAHLLPKSTGNTQEAMAPSQHD